MAKVTFRLRCVSRQTLSGTRGVRTEEERAAKKAARRRSRKRKLRRGWY